MWPWEHILFAYLCYSIYYRVRTRGAPAGPPTIGLVIGSLLPDVIDKPLFWEFGITSSGYTIGHSIFFAIPLCLFILGIAFRMNRPQIGIGFAFGYLLHLVGDVIPISIQRGELYYQHLLWPLVRSDHIEPHGSLFDGFRHHLGGYVTEIVSMDPSTAVIVQLSLGIAGFMLWMIDGLPGIPSPTTIRRSIRRMGRNRES